MPRLPLRARSPTARAPRAGPAAPPARADGRRPAPSSPGDEHGAVRRVLNDPTPVEDPVAKLVGGREVPRRAKVLPLADELEDVLGRRLRHEAEPEDGEAAVQEVELAR